VTVAWPLLPGNASAQWKQKTCSGSSGQVDELVKRGYVSLSRRLPRNSLKRKSAVFIRAINRLVRLRAITSGVTSPSSATDLINNDGPNDPSDLLKQCLGCPVAAHA